MQRCGGKERVGVNASRSLRRSQMLLIPKRMPPRASSVGDRERTKRYTELRGEGVEARVAETRDNRLQQPGVKQDYVYQWHAGGRGGEGGTKTAL